MCLQSVEVHEKEQPEHQKLRWVGKVVPTIDRQRFVLKVQSSDEQKGKK
jgi:hypothetical protein